MNTHDQATKRPWHVCKGHQPGIDNADETQTIVLYGNQGEDCGVCGETPEIAQANAALIVAAVNERDGLLAQNRAMRKYLTDALIDIQALATQSASGEKLTRETAEGIQKRYDKARAALTTILATAS